MTEGLVELATNLSIARLLEIVKKTAMMLQKECLLQQYIYAICCCQFHFASMLQGDFEREIRKTVPSA
ncbi:MAG: hypothetical protein KGM99_15435 [Burkholderiales bacterium]|nr:hypothetical protein [Burkholderiales bacterium]